ncbi:methyl-accepting chemotaxis protein [Virgibacillus sp. YIM 98842]|uniref:methyl-accepting chemotaxis protein n=1 Tax=Virgibacillus sp. YIM 98842 TaxID=2663533 RepID=UPI001F094A55|nr:methyl-accepting chemotaxis protein [Virgibacillus sp. YIM 98842]
MGKNKTRKIKDSKPKKQHGNRFNWKNVKLGKKYVSVYLLTAILFIAATVVVYFQLNGVQQDIAAIEEQSQRVNDMAEMAEIMQAKDVQTADFLLTENPAFIDAFHEYREEFNTLAEKLAPMMDTERERAIFEEITSNNEIIDNTFTDRLIPNVEDGDAALAVSLRDYSSRLRTQTIEEINKLMDIVSARQADSVGDAGHSMNASMIVLTAANALSVIIGIALLIWISRRISANLRNVVRMTREIADGNLKTASMDYNGKDEIGQLSAAVNQMKENIHHILIKVTDASDSVNQRSEELTQAANEVKEGNIQIATTMEELSSGAETQANSASDLSENMSRFVENVRFSEKSGQEVSAKSDEVLKLTQEGTTLMNKSVDQMKKIDTIVAESVDKVQGLDHQSDEISKLVKVIKDIADQTNLLSLNAAIEAARAGEHGRGFAVVADEVRKLSEQVAASVGEITQIVNNIQSETEEVVNALSDGYLEVQEGTSQIKTTGNSFETIYTAITDMVDKVSHISGSLKEIADNSAGMNNLIEEVASVSEESAAGVQEAAASAEQTSSSMEEVSYSADELAKLAEQLDGEVKVFKL